MPNKTPKFAELIREYKDALSTASDERADLDKQTEVWRLAEQALDVARVKLTSAMSKFGINSIREHSFEDNYFFLTTDGNLEPRKIVNPRDIDKNAESEAA